VEVTAHQRTRKTGRPEDICEREQTARIVDDSNTHL
jgi:hypothetical protein